MPFENVGPSLVPPYDGKLLCIVSLFPGGPKELSKINGGRAADEDEKKIASFFKKSHYKMHTAFLNFTWRRWQADKIHACVTSISPSHIFPMKDWRNDHRILNVILKRDDEKK